MKLANITKGRGDQGQTDLWLGGSVAKTDLRIAVLGHFDLFHAQLGLAIAHSTQPEHTQLLNYLETIQKQLIQLMGELATAPEKTSDYCARFPHITPNLVDSLTQHVQLLGAALDERKFTLSGWTLYGRQGLPTAQFDLATAELRRCELVLWQLNAVSPVRPELLTYCNRLSKLLFLVGRWVSLSPATLPEFTFQT